MNRDQSCVCLENESCEQILKPANFLCIASVITYRIRGGSLEPHTNCTFAVYDVASNSQETERHMSGALLTTNYSDPAFTPCKQLALGSSICARIS